MNWNETLHSLNMHQLRWVCCRLLGRSGISDEVFIQMCKDTIQSEEEE